MRLGYNTNGLAHHALGDAIDLVADAGYRAIAITLDHAALHPSSPTWQADAMRVRERLDARGLTPVVETGARYALDPRRKHWPTLLSAHRRDREQRAAYLRGSIDVAKAVGAKVVSLWSGTAESDESRDVLLVRLVDELLPLVETAEAAGVVLGFEPEPGMLIATLADYEELLGLLATRGVPGEKLPLTLDTVHLQCQGETPIADHIDRRAGQIVNVHLADGPVDRHEHLPLGQGSIDWPPVLAALSRLPADTPVCVELGRHSHEGPLWVQQSFEFVRSRISSE